MNEAMNARAGRTGANKWNFPTYFAPERADEPNKLENASHCCR